MRLRANSFVPPLICGAVCTILLAGPSSSDAVGPSGEILVADATDAALLGVDPLTGLREIVSGGGAGKGPPFVSPAAVTVDADGDIYVFDNGYGDATSGLSGPLGAVFKIDITTGDRTLVSAAGSPSQTLALGPFSLDGFGAGNVPYHSSSIGVLPGGQIVVAPSQSAAFLIRVDPDTGTRSVLSHSTGSSSGWVGSGVPFGNGDGIRAMAVAPDGTIYAHDFSSYDSVVEPLEHANDERILTIDASTGDRTVFTQNFVGGGTVLGPSPYVGIFGLMTVSGTTVLAPGAESSLGFVIGINAGARSTFSVLDDLVPMTPGAVDPDNGDVYGIGNRGDGVGYYVGRFDPISGARSLVSSNIGPSGVPAFPTTGFGLTGVAFLSPPPAPNLPPGSPAVLLVPGNRALVPPGRIAFDWSNSANATSYKLLVRKDSRSGPDVVDELTTFSQFRSKKLGPDGQKYFWRVKACNDLGCKKSTWHKFTLGRPN